MTVACEPTGHRWRVLGQLAAERGMSFVCVQPMLSAYARRTEDLTSDKTDDKDAVLIARLTAQLRCYLPEPVDPTVWGRLRHLGARREQLLESHTRCVQQIRDLLECVWPAVLEAAAQPFTSTTWVAALTVVVARDEREPGGDVTGPAGSGWTGSPGWCAPKWSGGARPSRACGSSGRSSRPSPLPPAWSSTGRPRWSGSAGS